MPYVVGVDGHGGVKDGFLVPSAYAGTLLFPFAFVGLSARRREGWFFLGFGLLILSVCVKTFAADIIATLPFFDIAINEYLIIVPIVCLCAAAALGADRLRQGQGRQALLVGAAISLVAVSLLYRQFAPLMKSLGMPAVYRRERLLLQLVPLLLGVCAAALSPRRLASTGLGMALVIFTASRLLEAGRINPIMPADAFYPPLPILAGIPRGVPARMTALGNAFIPNAAAVYGLEDVRGYEAMTLGTFWQTYPSWCVSQGFWFNRIDDPTTPFLAFLNVRWVLTPLDAPVPAGWTVLSESDGLRLLENPGALARVFVPAFYRGEPDSGKRLALIGEVQDFGQRGVIATDTGGIWIENGRARVTIDSYDAQTIGVNVEAESAALVGTSITNWPGWKADLDGRPTGAISFNHAFLAFRVPPGSHRLSVHYAPDGFRYGAAISLATVAVGALLLWLFRPKRLRLQRGSATTTD